MKTVDKDLAFLAEIRGADGVQSATTVGEDIGMVLQKIMPIIDNFASVSALSRPVEPTFNIHSVETSGSQVIMDSAFCSVQGERL